MDLVNDIDPVPSLCGRILHLFPYITYVLHTVVGRGIYFHHIHGGTRLNGPAGGTLIAGTPVHRMFAVHCPGKYLGYTGLTCSPGTAEQVSMADTLRRYLVFQCLHLRMVGIVLVISLLTVPQMTANLFSHRFHRIIWLSIGIGYLSCLGGLMISFYLNVPSGASIIFFSIIIYAICKTGKSFWLYLQR